LSAREAVLTLTPARAAIWLDETPGGVTMRIVDLRNSRIAFAENFELSWIKQLCVHQQFAPGMASTSARIPDDASARRTSKA